MAETFTLDLVTPEQQLFSKEVTQVDIPGEDGEFGVLAKHAPMISSLVPGIVKIYEGTSAPQSVFISGGFAEVTAERCTILAEEAKEFSMLAKGDAELRLKEAEKILSSNPAETDRRKAEKEAAIAKAQIAVL